MEYVDIRSYRYRDSKEVVGTTEHESILEQNGTFETVLSTRYLGQGRRSRCYRNTMRRPRRASCF